MVARPTRRQVFAVNCTPGLPRPWGRAGALNLGDDSGRHEDLWNHGATPSFGWKSLERSRREEYARKNTTEENEINVRQLTRGIKRSWIGMDALTTYLEFSP